MKSLYKQWFHSAIDQYNAIVLSIYVTERCVVMQHLRRQQQKLLLVIIAFIQHWRLQIALWITWTLAVCFTAFVIWHHDRALHMTVNTVGLVIHCSLIGILGMIVITYIEMHWQPWRFFAQD